MALKNGTRAAPVLRRVTRQFHAVNRKHLTSAGGSNEVTEERGHFVILGHGCPTPTSLPSVAHDTRLPEV
ncbi:MAG: hypothetical protein ABJB66_21950, partial [Gemmatimonadaceae bacterium]